MNLDNISSTLAQLGHATWIAVFVATFLVLFFPKVLYRWRLIDRPKVPLSIEPTKANAALLIMGIVYYLILFASQHDHAIVSRAQFALFLRSIELSAALLAGFVLARALHHNTQFVRDSSTIIDRSSDRKLFHR